MLPRGFVYEHDETVGREVLEHVVEARRCSSPNGPPWISRISGYFFDASNDGGFTIQPMDLRVAGRRVRDLLGLRELLALQHVAVDVGELRRPGPAASGCSARRPAGDRDRRRCPAAIARSFDTESNVSMCVPVVTGLTPPHDRARTARCARRDRRRRSRRPLPSGAQRMLIGSRSKSPLIFRMSLEPPMTGPRYRSLDRVRAAGGRVAGERHRACRRATRPACPTRRALRHEIADRCRSRRRRR